MNTHEHAHKGDCRQYLGTLSDYFDGTLDEDLCRELEMHITECKNCRIVVNTFSKTITLYQQMPSPELPGDVKDRLYKVLEIRPKTDKIDKADKTS